jgi:hypothetical protein
MPIGFSVGIDGRLARNEPLNSSQFLYKIGILYSKKYDLKALPDDAVGRDLKAALDAYQDYAKAST